MNSQETQKINNGAALVLLDEAKTSIVKGDMITAVVKLTRCLMADNSFAEAYMTRGNLLLAMGDADGAADDARWLMEHTAPNDALKELRTRIASVYKERGRMKYSTGDTVGAENDVRNALQMNPNCMEPVSGQYTAEGVEQKVKRTFGMANAHNMGTMSNNSCHDCEKSKK